MSNWTTLPWFHGTRQALHIKTGLAFQIRLRSRKGCLSHSCHLRMVLGKAFKSNLFLLTKMKKTRRRQSTYWMSLLSNRILRQQAQLRMSPSSHRKTSTPQKIAGKIKIILVTAASVRKKWILHSYQNSTTKKKTSIFEPLFTSRIV
jgi:hypothetical protein